VRAARRSSLASIAIADSRSKISAQPERAVAGIGDLGLDLAEFGGR
jgi:hypothetical protein